MLANKAPHPFFTPNPNVTTASPRMRITLFPHIPFDDNVTYTSSPVPGACGAPVPIAR